MSRISANHKTNLPIMTTEGEATDNTPPALPTTSGLLSGVPSTSPLVVSSTSISKMSETDRLPDLVVNQPVSKLNIDCHLPAAINTAEDLEAASTLLSLSDALEDPPDEDNDDNALLMPIGGINIQVDIAPQEIKLDQVSVDKTIAGIVETEQLKRAFEKETSENPLKLLIQATECNYLLRLKKIRTPHKPQNQTMMSPKRDHLKQKHMSSRNQK